jgi:EAL domain-containing protein (putative c-di-GMP-specific phosphodiesterase class I)
MYRAKATSATHCVYAPHDDNHTPERLALAGDLRRGIDSDELVLFYQPKVALEDDRIVGVEALVRWEHPRLGLLGPGAFIGLAEDTGLIKTLTLWVIDEALRQCAAWRAHETDLAVAVNVSMRSLLDRQFPEQVALRLRDTGIDPSRLILEITESTIMADPDAVLSVLNQLGDMGITLAIDDFGTGYSSLAYLRELPVDQLKVDRSFVTPLLRSRNDEVIVRATVELGHNLGLHVVAEGVEDGETLAELRRLGCDQAQGFHVSRPLPANELSGWLAGRRATRPAAEPVYTT